MKFTPESLLQIYMDGSFTEDAQAEFDKLVRKDPAFAEKVSRAVAERIGEAPEQDLAQVEGRLDAKMGEVWNRHRPSPFLMVLKRAAVLALALLAAGGFYSLARHSAPLFHWVSSAIPSLSQSAPNRSDLSPSALTEDHPVQGPSMAHRRPQPSAASASQLKSRPSSKSASYASARSAGSVASSARSAPPLVPSIPSQAGSGSAPMGYPSAPPSTSNPAGMTSGAPPAASMGNPQSSMPGQGTAGLPALEPALPSAQGANAQSKDRSIFSVSIETQKTQNVVVTVLDSNGNQVRQLYQGQWNAGIHMVDWDGKDDSANAVLPGNYTVMVNADGKTMSGGVTVEPNTVK